jgi:hypothetical protein
MAALLGAFNETLSTTPHLLLRARRICRYSTGHDDRGLGRGKGAESSGEFEMLSKRLCPHTGVVNFFFEREPHFAVGSVVKADGRYLWRCYTDPFEAVGEEADIGLAEQRVADLCRKAAAYPDAVAQL